VEYSYLIWSASKIEMAPLLKFPKGWANVLRHLAIHAEKKAQEEYRNIRRDGISILGVQFDRGEHFVMWKAKGETHLFRIHVSKLREEAQKRLDSMVIE
jgi:hypothetical protein